MVSPKTRSLIAVEAGDRTGSRHLGAAAERCGRGCAWPAGTRSVSDRMHFVPSLPTPVAVAGEIAGVVHRNIRALLEVRRRMDREKKREEKIADAIKIG